MAKKPLTQKIYEAARALLPEMDPEMRHLIEDLLEQAERGLKTDNRIVELLSADPVLRLKLNGLLQESAGEHVLMGGYSPSAGDVSSPGAPKFICPECGFTRYLQKAGEDPGVCPKDGRPLVPFVEQGEGQ